MVGKELEVKKQELLRKQRIGPDKGVGQQQGIGPAKIIRNQVAVWADSETSMLEPFCPRQEASWQLPAQVETYLILWPAYPWRLATPGSADPGLL